MTPLKPFSNTIDSKQETFQPVKGSEPGLEPFSAGIHQVAADTFGGPGSGHHDHEGRPGKVGGSQPGEGTPKAAKGTKSLLERANQAALDMGRGPGQGQDFLDDIKWAKEGKFELGGKEIDRITRYMPELIADFKGPLTKEHHINKEHYDLAKALGVETAKDTERYKNLDEISDATWKKIYPVISNMQSNPEKLTQREIDALRKAWPEKIEKALKKIER